MRELTCECVERLRRGEYQWRNCRGERRGRGGRVIHRLFEELQGAFLYYIKETFAKLKERLKDVRNKKKLSAMI